MTDIQTLTRPLIFDAEALHEFADALVDRAHDIERDIDRLSKDPDNKLLIADIFRGLHNIKGDAALCRVPMAGLIAHPIESIVTRLRSGEVRYSQLLAEVILLGVDRLEMAVEALVAGKPVVQLKLVKLVEGLERLSQLPQSEIDRGAVQVIKEVTGFQPQAAMRAATVAVAIQSQSKDSMASDLKFFRSLAMQFEARSKVFAGRTERIRHLALSTNREAGTPVDEVQLEAAVYLHDVGMMFLPETMWLKVGKMSTEERALLRTHPDFAAGLLGRMNGWASATEMVRQHHESWAGDGYPAGLMGNHICTGAKILSIVDAFDAVMLKHSSRNHTSSVLRAIAEVNACDKQFAPELIEPFNTVIRGMLER